MLESISNAIEETLKPKFQRQIGFAKDASI